MKISRLRLALVFLLIIISGLFIYTMAKPAITEVDTFNECAEAGYPVSNSEPRKCTTYEGEIFTEQTTLMGEVE